MSAILEKEIEQVNEYAGLLDEAFASGDLQNNMLAMPAFQNVAAIQLVGELEVQNSDAKTEAPTQLSGSCQISGLRVSEFLEPQRDAFKSAMAASTGATKSQVVIKRVSASNSARRHLRRLLADADDILVEFAVVAQRDSDPEPPAEGLSAEVATTIALCSIFGVLVLTAGIVLFIYMRRRVRVGVSKDKNTKDTKYTTGPGSKHDDNPKSVEMTVPSKRNQPRHSSSTIAVTTFSKSTTNQ